MKCPHCLESFFEEWQQPISVGKDKDGQWYLKHCYCADCKRIIIMLEVVRGGPVFPAPTIIPKSYMVWPKSVARTALPEEVPERFSGDYREAFLVLSDSPKASAALSRRCLQHLLREVAKVKPSNLSDEIGQVMKSLPSHLAESIDAVRNIGNFAAHPVKSTSTGEIVEVEPGEAEWLLDVLEGLFDFYFVQPARLKKKRQALDAKLKDAGKPEMK